MIYKIFKNIKTHYLTYKNTNLLRNIIYYNTIISGLIITSWILWARFLRERIIRDVPDALFTNYVSGFFYIFVLFTYTS